MFQNSSGSMTIFQGHTNEHMIIHEYSNIVIFHKYWNKLSILLLILETNLLLEFILFRFIRVHSKLDSIILATFVHLQSFFSLFLKTTFPQFVVISIHLIAPFVPLSVHSRTKRVGEPQSFHTDSNTQETMVTLFFFVKSALSPLFSTFSSAR